MEPINVSKLKGLRVSCDCGHTALHCLIITKHNQRRLISQIDNTYFSVVSANKMKIVITRKIEA